MSPADLPPLPAPAISRTAAVAPGTDPLTARQGFLAQIDWTPPSGGRRPLVAVLDTGVDSSHPDLVAAVPAGAGRSFVPGSSDPARDPQGHGTHVAGIIAATSGNGVGGSGVSDARILPVTIADSRGRTTTSALVRGLRYASARGARVINISFGGRGFSAVEQRAIDDATRRGALVVAAAGNRGGRQGGPDYPGAYRQVLAVAALGTDGRVLGISQRGEQVGIAAPGEDVASVPARSRRGVVAPGLVTRTGTSMAAAVVTGAAARILSRRPGLSAQQVRGILEATARDVPPTGADIATGAGALDLRAALAARPPAPGDPEPNDDIDIAARTRPLLTTGGPDQATRQGTTGTWSDPADVARVVLRAGEPLSVVLTPSGTAAAGDLDLLLWRPGTPSGRRGPAVARRWLAAASLGPRAAERIDLVVPRSGVYSLEVRGVRGGETGGGRGAVAYALTATRERPAPATTPAVARRP